MCPSKWCDEVDDEDDDNDNKINLYESYQT